MTHRLSWEVGQLQIPISMFSLTSKNKNIIISKSTIIFSYFFKSCGSLSSWFIFNKSFVNWSITIQYSLTSICLNYPVSPDLRIYYLPCTNKYTSCFTEYVPTLFVGNHHKWCLLCLFPNSSDSINRVCRFKFWTPLVALSFWWLNPLL